MDRVIALVDMDCFYCQVEERLNPELKGLPVAVVQYNPWKGGGIIAVNYEARSQGVTRAMRGDQAKEYCPDLVLVTIPTVREKADLSRYRNASKEVLDVFCDFCDCVQRASIDEAYLDISSAVQKRMPEFSQQVSPTQMPNTFIVGYSAERKNSDEERAEGAKNWLSDVFSTCFYNEEDRRLAVGAIIVEEMRKAVFQRTGFLCSAGIAHNKILAKLAAGLHKPNRQTILPHGSVEQLFKTLPIRKVRNLGGKLGRQLEEKYGCKFMGDVTKLTEKELRDNFGSRAGTWLFNLARGYDHDPVTPRIVSKSLGCCKNFPGRNGLTNHDDVDRWINNLATDFLERLVDDQVVNKRRAQQMVLNVQTCKNDRSTDSWSRSTSLSSYAVEKIVASAYMCLKQICAFDNVKKTWSPAINHLGFSAGRFLDSVATITDFFKSTSYPEVSTSHKLSLDGSAGPSFFEKEIFENANSKDDSQVSNLNEENLNYEKADKTERSTIKKFFEASKSKNWVEPVEIFPDVNNIDEEILNLMPASFKRKVLEHKSANGAHVQPSDSSFDHRLSNNNREESSATSTEHIFSSASPVVCETIFCSECNKAINSEVMEEHKDYHYASKLHRELNKDSIETLVRNNGDSPKKVGTSADSLKRKLKLNTKGRSAKGNPSTSKIRRIDSFFKR